MDAGIKKIIELIKRTGDRFVVLDAESQEPFVVMTFDEYENLMGGGECLCESCQDEELKDEDSVEEENDKEILGAPETLRPFGRSEEGELIEKINRDIAEWRERQQSAVTENLAVSESEESRMSSSASETLENASAALSKSVQPILEKKNEEITDEKYYFEPVAG